MPNSAALTNPSLKEVSSPLRAHVVYVAGHTRPDGDCVGSQIAMTRVLRYQGVEAYLLINDPIPSNLREFLADTPTIPISQARLNDVQLVCVDTADEARLGTALHPFLALGKPYILVDHHRTTRPYAEYNFIDVSAAATTEILGRLFLESGFTIDPVTAQALYLGIMTDTGQFAHASTKPNTLRLAATLVEYGASPALAHYQLYEQETIPRLQLLQRFLSSLQLENEGHICIGSLTQNDYQLTHTKPEDTEGFVDYARKIQGVEIGAFLEEQPNGVKGSLRARDEDYRLDLLAAKFGGGGHACAAGFRVNESLSTFYPQFIAAAKAHLEQVHRERLLS